MDSTNRGELGQFLRTVHAVVRVAADYDAAAKLAFEEGESHVPYDEMKVKPGMVLVREGCYPPIFNVSNGGGSKGIGHAAIVSADPTKIIEAVDYDTVKFSSYKSFFNQTGTYYWIWPYYHEHTPIVKPTPVEDSFGVSAAAYAEKQIGKPYNTDYFDKYKTDSFYCSSLCWRSWYEQGFEIGVTIGCITLTYVAPNDLVIGTYSHTENKWEKK